jgi:DNA (cytosine-5)-methyltransferase 1
MGYRVGWGSWGAVDIGACHRRERVFVVAHRDGEKLGVRGKRVLRKPALTETSSSDQSDPDLSIDGIGELPVRKRGSRKASADTIGKDRNAPDMHVPGLQGHGQDGKRPCEFVAWERAWQESWHEVATRFCGMDDGIPAELDGLDRHSFGIISRRERKKRLHCLGNSVVPQQVYPILKAIADIENKGGFP